MLTFTYLFINFEGPDIFEQHFPSDAAAMSVPSVPSVACSNPVALDWDEAFKNQNDPSGRAVAKVHDDAYN